MNCINNISDTIVLIYITLPFVHALVDHTVHRLQVAVNDDMIVVNYNNLT